jgi:hypothetical protein
LKMRLALKPLMNTQCVGDEFYFSELAYTQPLLLTAHLIWLIVIALVRVCPLKFDTRRPDGLDGE